MNIQLSRSDAPLPDDVILAVVIKGCVEDEGQRHTGFLVRGFDDENHLFHLGYNNGYRQNKLGSEYDYLVVPALEPETANAIISFLVLLLEKTQGKVKYSIAWDDDQYFGDDASLKKDDAGDGFTCATFVLETFKRYGLNLVDRATWPLSKSNHDWQRNMIDLLCLPMEQYLAQLAVVGQYPRIRPEEALGAAHYYKGTSLPYVFVAPAAFEVLTEMRRLRD